MSHYDRALVEHLLPAIWDEGYAYGLVDPYAPDPDMPRALVDPSRANTLYAHLADIRIAWKRAPLTASERRVLFLRYALDWPQKRIARHEGVAESTVSERVGRAIRQISCHLTSADLTH